MSRRPVTAKAAPPWVDDVQEAEKYVAQIEAAMEAAKGMMSLREASFVLKAFARWADQVDEPWPLSGPLARPDVQEALWGLVHQSDVVRCLLRDAGVHAE